MSGHTLLFRLFATPGWFSVLRGLQYLRSYNDNVGITHYIVYRLDDEAFDDELADKWGLVCHLLVSLPSKSAALENFVLKKSERSTLFALLTLWFLQCSMNDLSKLGPSTDSFATCQRLLRRTTQIIFNTPDPPVDVPFSGIRSFLSAGRHKAKPHFAPALAGLGLMMGGSFSQPRLVHLTGPMILNQMRRTETAKGVAPTPDRDIAHVADIPASSPSTNPPSPIPDVPEDNEALLEVAEDEGDVEAYGRSLIAARMDPSLDLYSKARPSSSIPLRGSSDPHPSLSVPPVGHGRRSEEYLPKHAHRGQRSTQSLSISDPSQALELNPRTNDRFSQSALLRNHYLHSELQFIQALEAISNKLLVVPKLARVSALRAELTTLNHQLPAEVCLPMWCKYPVHHEHQTDTQAHHRIVRIPPGESVVLNSAERAPYLLILEVLHGDLDFDPNKRPNKDLLGRLVKESPGNKGIRDVIHSPTKTHTGTNESEQPILGSIIPPTPLDGNPMYQDEPEDGVDLVEQLYGADLSMRTVEAALSDAVVLPSAPKNKILESAAWERSGSLPGSPVPATASPHPMSANAMRPKSFASQLGGHRSATLPASPSPSQHQEGLTLEDYSNRMEAAAVMLAQLNANLIREPVTGAFGAAPAVDMASSALRWIPGSGWLMGTSSTGTPTSETGVSSATLPSSFRMRLQPAEAQAIRERIMKEMLALEEERVERMKVDDAEAWALRREGGRGKTAEDEGIVRRELNKVDPSAAVFQESWNAKKARIRSASPYGHLANWDCVSCIVKTGADLRQEQLACQLLQEFGRIWREEGCPCWVKYFRILITGSNSGLVEVVRDAVSIHSIKKSEYARRLVAGNFTNVSLLEHFISTYGETHSAKFTRAQRNFAMSLAGYSVICYILQIKDRHNGNLLIDRDGHIIHIDWGFLLETSPGGNLGFEAAPFKLPWEYVEVLGGLESNAWSDFKRYFREGFMAARKHCDSIITIVELMQKGSTFPCFAAFGEQTAQRLRDRFQPTLSHSLVADHCDKLIASSLGSAWTRLYDSYQYYSQGVL